jgi:hypothetical protein
MTQTKRKALVACFGSALQDPPTRNAVQYLLQHDWAVTILQRDQRRATGAPIYGDCRLVEALRATSQSKAARLMEIAAFAIKLNYLCHRLEPDALIGVMLHAYGLINARVKRRAKVTVCSILDIPVAGASGRSNEPIFSRGIKKLGGVDVIWASDKYKAGDIRKIAELERDPIICHNCPVTDYMLGQLWPRDAWLRSELARRFGSAVPETACVLLRSGALGPHGGIEETLLALTEIPEVIFVLVGQISPGYQYKIESICTQLGLNRRVTIVKSPSDDVWKLCLRGADVGHMIHFRPDDGYSQQAYDLNSTLSNNRLFQYMAAGLPILVNEDARLDSIMEQVPSFISIRQAFSLADLKAVLKNIVWDFARRRSLGMAGRLAHQKTYNWEHQFEPVYNAISQKIKSSRASEITG